MRGQYAGYVRVKYTSLVVLFHVLSVLTVFEFPISQVYRNPERERGRERARERRRGQEKERESEREREGERERGGEREGGERERGRERTAGEGEREGVAGSLPFTLFLTPSGVSSPLPPCSSSSSYLTPTSFHPSTILSTHTDTHTRHRFLGRAWHSPTLSK